LNSANPGGSAFNDLAQAVLIFPEKLPIYKRKERTMVRGVPNLSIAYKMPHGGKMSFPVDPSSLIYSQLQHISGVVAPEGTQGVAISKLNLLDALIGQLNQVKRDSSPQAPTADIDALIENYRNQIEQIIAAGEAMPYIHSPSAEPGLLFSLST